MTEGPAPVERIRAAFVGGEFDEIPVLIQEGLDEASDPGALLDDGMIPGLREVGEQFQRGEVYLPEMMMAADAWQEGMDLLGPLLAAEGRRGEAKAKVVLGSVKGDVHSLGKNIEATMLQTAGFEVVDLGSDVPAAAFVEEAEKARADIIALSALMTTTMAQQQDVIQHLEARGGRAEYYVMVGGGPTTAAWAQQIGADGYGQTAADAVDLALAYVEARR
ncbi:MAG: corrinoid protein [Thermoleophilia bacterium]|jgi:trimethylamine corrinoid protein|nr:corrinoid protein [Thermoleophilia bacterium]